MEVKPGYKQTEVGLIPEDWEVNKLGQISVIDPENLPGNTDPNYTFNYISLEDVDYGRLLSFKELIFSDSPSRARRKMKLGDILFSTVRPNLKSHLFFSSTSNRFICSTGFSVVRCDEKLINPKYVYFHLFGTIIEKQIDALITGSNYPAINSTDVKSMNLPIPPLPEQTAIATALSDVDALISALDRLIEKKRAIKQAAMQELLTGKRRLPGFDSGKGYKQTEVGEIPVDWDASPLKKLVKEFIVPMRDKPKLFRGRIPWCRIEDFDGKYLTDSKSQQYVDEEIIKLMNLRIHPINTVLVSCSANLGICAIVKYPLVTNQTFIGLVCDEISSSEEYIFYFMTFFSDKLNTQASGTTISYLSRKQFEEFIISTPPLPEQTAIATVLSDMDAEISALETRRAKTISLKQGMMQELLTGRVRLV